MIELRRVSWKNFLSYGDYVSTIDLEHLGQVSITGEIDEEPSKSNGAGKSTIANAIQWCLFGRTMHSARPGNNVINHYTNKDCYVKLEFKSGDQVIRTRAVNGHDELIYVKDGLENKLSATTASTNSNMQEQLNKLFNLDYELFIYGVFFNQYGKSWAEQTEAVRRKILERLMRVDRYSYYARAAKAKADSIDRDATITGNAVTNVENTVKVLAESAASELESSATFEQTTAATISMHMESIASFKADHDAIPSLSEEELSVKWALCESISQSIAKNEMDLAAATAEKYKLNAMADNLKSQVQDWEAKKGTTCSNCKQTVAKGHVDGNIESLKQKQAIYKKKIGDNNIVIGEFESALRTNKEALQRHKPEYSAEQIRRFKAQKAKHVETIKGLIAKVKALRAATNPYHKRYDDLITKFGEAQVLLDKHKLSLSRQQLLYKHMMYIYKAYNDKNKLKSLIYKEFVPAFNNRLKKYLEILKMDIIITLNDNLSMSSSSWGYDYMSGGERKRVDLAFMFTLYDMHEYLHGRQCNILVLDEVDGRLDDEGVESFISIIKNEIAPRVETIFVISHRPEMHDVFEREIKVIRKGRFSVLESR